MNRRITALILVVGLFVVSLFTQGTLAWFTDANVVEKDFYIGDLHYIYKGDFVSVVNKKFVPGETLITTDTLMLTNKSTIDSNLRLQIRFSFTDREAPFTVYEDEHFDPSCALLRYIKLTLNDSWVYDSDDECYHFKYGTGVEQYKLPIPADLDIGYDLPLLDEIYFEGDTITADFSGMQFKIKILFQAKQHEFVDWETIGTVELLDLLN